MPITGETRLDSAHGGASGSHSRDRYVVLGPLSKGGMAELQLAQQLGVKGFSRTVALKRVLPSHAEDAAFLEMFLDEARLAARLDHPNIVRIYELGQDGESYFLAMEYLPGEDLRQLHQVLSESGSLVAPEMAAHLVERTADALHFAHELTDENGSPLHLVHRDVSPSNVIVTYDGQVKVVDFGIAKARSNAFETVAGVLKGKLGYLAPEQFTGAPLDRRTDVFGLGILLWELLSNTRLFARDSPAASMAAASQGTVPPLSTYRDDVGPALEGIVHKALARNPAERFQTAGEMRDALEHFLRTEVLPPTTRDVASWINALGGKRRAELKTSIARGTNIAACYAELVKLRWDQAPLSATSSSTSRRRKRPAWHVAVFAGVSAALLAVAGVATTRARPAAAAPPVTASAHLESDPPGAFVFLRGEPTGRVTPVTLTGLDPTRPLQFRLEKPGHAPVEGEVALQAGAEASRRVTLVARQGSVRFLGVPRGAAVRVGDQLFLAGQDALLPPGRQTAEVVQGGQVIATHAITVAPGPQDISLAGDTP